MKTYSKNALYISPAILIGIFFLFVFTPLIKTLCSPHQTVSKVENRTLSSFPDLNITTQGIQSFPGKFESYFNDQFGFRDHFIFLHNYVKALLLKQSPVPKVILGKNGWLFLKTEPEGSSKPTIAQLKAMRLHLETKRDWLASKGIRYLYIPAPNKQTIYPEYLHQKKEAIDKPSQFDDLVAYLKINSEFKIIDVRPALTDLKQNYRVYHLTDHHWNDTGAFTAYEKIMNRIQQWFPGTILLSSQDVENSTYTSAGMSLANMMGLPSSYREDVLSLTVKHGCSEKTPYKKMVSQWYQKGSTEDEEDWYRKRIPVKTICENSNLKAVVFRDSFFEMILPFFSQHFKEVVYIWSRFDYTILSNLIEQLQPDIVIEECTESEIFLFHIPGEINKTKGFDLLINGKKEAAVREFDKALQIKPKDPDSYNNLGFALFQIRRFPEAKKLFQIALRMAPHHAKARTNLENVNHLVQKLDSEISRIQTKLTGSPKNPELLNSLGLVLQRKGEFQKAIRQFHKILTFQPDNPTAMNNLAIAYAATKQYQESICLLKKLIQVHPKKGNAYYNLACIYSIQNNISESIKNLKAALQNGYKDFKQIKLDKDLENIRNTTFYKNIAKAN